jgi:hypothetical protein
MIIDTMPFDAPTGTLRILLPDGIGYVEIRTGSVHGPSGNPVVAVETVSYTVDQPAKDGRLYEPRCDPPKNTVFLVGYPNLKDEHIHKFETIASWPAGPNGETGEIRACSCGDQYTSHTTRGKGDT